MFFMKPYMDEMLLEWGEVKPEIQYKATWFGLKYPGSFPDDVDSDFSEWSVSEDTVSDVGGDE